jgi:putative ABC transport system permease protein
VGRTATVDRGAGVILLTLRDLRFRAVRFVVVILLAAVVFALLFVMTGLVEQFHLEPYDTVDAFGASTWVLPEGVSGPFTASSTMPAATVEVVVATSTAPVVTARSSITTGSFQDEVILVGHDVGTMGSPPTVEGRAAEVSGEVAVDESMDVDIGDSVNIAGEEFEVVGRTDDTTLLAGVPLVFMVLEDAQELVFRSRDVISAVLVDGEPTSVPGGTVAVSSGDIADDTLHPLEGAIASIDFVRILLWVVAAVIIGAVVYLSALERQRDFAVLKAIGTSNRTLLASLALQAVIVALAAVALAAAIQLFLAPAFPLKVSVPTRAFWQLPLFAVVMALLAGLAGMRRVARSDPALAFAGAGG